MYLLKRYTRNCKVKCDSVEKLQSYRLFNMTDCRFFGVKNVQAKMLFKIQKLIITLLLITSHRRFDKR